MQVNETIAECFILRGCLRFFPMNGDMSHKNSLSALLHNGLPSLP